jgi:predicted alpha/beta-fold hydrolase
MEGYASVVISPMILASPFSPPRLLANRHMQTCLGGLGGRYRLIPSPTIRTIEGTDGDFFEVASWGCPEGASGRIVLLHGLEGSIRSGYLRRLIKRLTSLGRYEVDLVFLRGCGPSLNRLLRSYHAGFTDDLRTYLSLSVQPTLLVGFSIGGNIILKFLGEEGSQIEGRVRGAVVISAPTDLAATAEGIAAIPLYEKYFISSFRRKHRAKVARGIAPSSFADFRNISTFLDYDGRYTAPLFGYSSANEYWKANSSAQFIPEIRVPCRIISARDDPFFSAGSFPINECRHHRWVDLELSEQGGHTGFLSSLGSSPTFAERRVIEFAQSLFGRFTIRG